MSLRSTLRRYAADVARAFNRAPVECVLTVIVAFYISLGIEDNGIGDEVAHFTIAAILIAGVAWSATLAHAMRGISSRGRWATTLAGGIAGALYLQFTHNIDRSSEGWRAFMLVDAVSLLAFAVPALVRSPDNATLRLRRINSRVFLRAVGIKLYGLALFAGLAVALASIDNLFELHIHGGIYGHVFVWIMIILVPWVIIGGLDDYVRPLDEQSEVTRVAHKLASFLLPPLVALYFLILLAYMVRIAVTHELPRNLVSPMVISAGLLSCIALIVFDPAPDAAAGMRWLRFTPVLFLPVAPIGWWAVYARMSDYGWTEFRSLRTIALVALFALAVGALVQLVRRQPYSLRMIPAGLAASLALSAIGPWGVLPVSRRSQQHRLRDALAEARVDPRSPPSAADTTPRKISARLYKRIDGAASYLESQFGAEAVRAVVPSWDGHTRERAEYGPDRYTRNGVTGYFHLAPDREAPGYPSPVQTFASMHANVPVTSAEGVFLRIDASSQHARAGTVAWASHDSVFVVVAGEPFAMDLTAVVGSMQTTPRGDTTLPAAAASVDAFAVRDGTKRGSLTVIEIALERRPGAVAISHLNGLLKLKGHSP